MGVSRPSGGYRHFTGKSGSTFLRVADRTELLAFVRVSGLTVRFALACDRPAFRATVATASRLRLARACGVRGEFVVDNLFEFGLRQSAA
jgi:hypothetical protein